MSFGMRQNNRGSMLILSMVLLGFLSTLSLSLLFITAQAKSSLENRAWISKARFQSETSLRSSEQFYDNIPEITDTDLETLYVTKETGFRVPEFTLPNYLFQSGTTLYSVIDWDHTRCIFTAEYKTDASSFTVRKIRRL